MKNEILPVGTEKLLRSLGYVLDVTRERWLCGEGSRVSPDSPPVDYVLEGNSSIAEVID